MDKDLEILQTGIHKLEKSTSKNPSLYKLVDILENLLIIISSLQKRVNALEKIQVTDTPTLDEDNNLKIETKTLGDLSKGENNDGQKPTVVKNNNRQIS